MARREGSIYYQNIKEFDFDKTCNFLAREGISLASKRKLHNSKILALDDEGDDYEISYEQAKKKVLNSDYITINTWLNEQEQIFWAFRSQEGYFIMDFYVGFLSQAGRDKVSKMFFKFFLNEINFTPRSLLGMFIDKNGHTYDYDFAPVFFTDSEEVDYVTDLICLPKEKFGLVVMEPGFKMQELNNGFICASRYPEFLDYLMSSS